MYSGLSGEGAWLIYLNDVCLFVVSITLSARILFEGGSDLETFWSKEKSAVPFPQRAAACVSLKGLHRGVQSEGRRSPCWLSQQIAVLAQQGWHPGLPVWCWSGLLVADGPFSLTALLFTTKHWRLSSPVVPWSAVMGLMLQPRSGWRLSAPSY